MVTEQFAYRNLHVGPGLHYPASVERPALTEMIFQYSSTN